MDLNGKLNSEKFQLKNDMHMNRELQGDFNELGENQFVFEVMDRLVVKEDPGSNYGNDLLILESMWLEKLQPYAAGGYHQRKP